LLWRKFIPMNCSIIYRTREKYTGTLYAYRPTVFGFWFWRISRLQASDRPTINICYCTSRHSISDRNSSHFMHFMWPFGVILFTCPVIHCNSRLDSDRVKNVSVSHRRITDGFKRIFFFLGGRGWWRPYICPGEYLNGWPSSDRWTIQVCNQSTFRLGLLSLRDRENEDQLRLGRQDMVRTVRG